MTSIKEVLIKIKNFVQCNLKPVVCSKRTDKIFSSIILFVVIGISLYFFILPNQSEASWWNDNWRYRKPIAITGTGADLSDFQVSVTIDTASLISAGKMKSDCSDLRFSDQYGEVIPHWIEENSPGCNNAATIVWLKISEIPALGTKVYSYYGNSNAEDAQSGDSVFEFFDDFNETSLSSTKWEEDAVNTITDSFNNGNLRVTDGTKSSSTYWIYDNTDTGSQHVAKYGIVDDVVVEWRQSIADTESNKMGEVGFALVDASNGIEAYLHYYDGHSASVLPRRVWLTGATSDYEGAGVYETANFKMIRSGSDVYHYVDDDAKAHGTLLASPTSLALAVGAYGGYPFLDYVDVDWVFTRKYASSEPIIGSPGTEEKIDQLSPYLHLSFDEGYGTTAYNRNGTSVKRDPVAYYKMDETSGTTSFDDTLNEYDGTMTNMDGATDHVAGYHGWALDFDGSNDYVEVDYNSDLAPVSEITAEAWFYTNSTSSNQRILSKTESGGYQLSLNEGSVCGSDTLCMTVYVGGSYHSATIPSSSLSNSTWYHVAGTYDGETVKLFLDGLEVDSNTSPSGDISYNSSNPFCIGSEATASACTGGAYFSGMIDEVEVYNYALSSSEIWSEYKQTNGNLINMDPATDWVEGAVAQSGNSPMGHALDFNGTDDYVVSANDGFDGTQGTIEGWFYAHTYGQYRHIVNIRTTSTNEVAVFLNSAGSLLVEVGDAGQTTCQSSVPAEEWHHFTLTWDNGDLSCYFDGDHKVDSTYNGTVTKQNLYIGSSIGGSYFDGIIDEIKVYSYPRTASQVKTDYNSAKADYGASSVQGAGDKYTGDVPIGEWLFDEGRGLVAYDTSGNNQAGSLISMNQELAWVSGKMGTGLVFDGDDDYVELGEIFNDVTLPVTVSGWVYRQSSNYSTLFASDDTTNYYGFRIHVNSSNNIEVTYGDGTGASSSTRRSKTSERSVGQDAWSHITAVINGATDMQIYINGVEAGGTYSGTGGSMVHSTSGPARIGTYKTTKAEDIFDHIRVYDYARSIDQVHEDMMGSPIAYWKMDEGYGTTANNSKEYVNEAGLLGWWKFDDDTGQITVANSEINDKFGTIQNMETADWVEGRIGRGLIFDGVDEYIDIGGDLGDPSEMTLSFWFKKPAINEGAQYLADGRNGGSWWLLQDYVAGDCTDSEGNICYDTRCQIPSSSLSNDTWYHVTVTDSLQECNIYLNGVLVDTGQGEDLSIGSNMHIGTRYTNSAYFRGTMDNWKVYGRALSAAEVSDEYDTMQGHMLNMDSATDWVDGNLGRAIDFDGTNDYISVQETNGTDFGSNGFTLEAWVKTSTVGQYQYIISQSTYSGYSEEGQYALYVHPAGIPCLRIGIDPGDDYDEACSGSFVADDAWHHIVGIVDPAQSIFSIYVDGALTGGDDIFDTLSNSHDQNLALGALLDSDGTLSGYFDGQLDEVKIYNYPITSDEVVLEYNSPSPSPLFEGTSVRYGDPDNDPVSMPEPIGWWKLDERDGETVFDLSNNENNGTITGTSSVPGHLGRARTIAGEGDYIDLGNPSDLQFDSGDFTVSGWINSNDQSSEYGHFFTRYDSGLAHWQVRLNDDQKILFYIRDSASDNAYVTATDTCDVGSWCHFTGIRDGNSIYLYVNGIYQGTADATSVGDVDNSSNIYIGADVEGYNREFLGDVDNFKIWDVALSASQVAWEYNQGKPLLYLKLDQESFISCAGSTENVCDSGSHSYHGTSAGSMTTSSWVEGSKNNGLDLDGVDDGVSFGVDPIRGAGGSISFWINSDGKSDTSNDGIITNRIDTTSNWEIWISKHYANDTLVAEINGYDVIGEAMAPNEWHHFILTWGSSGAYLYKNGELVDSLSGPVTPTEVTSNLIVGWSYLDTNTRHFNGTLDEVKIYNYQLSEEQVQVDYNNGVVRFTD